MTINNYHNKNDFVYIAYIAIEGTSTRYKVHWYNTMQGMQGTICKVQCKVQCKVNARYNTRYIAIHCIHCIPINTICRYSYRKQKLK